MALITQVAPSNATGWRTWVPVLSAVVAILALLVTSSNRRIAKKALMLSVQQEERRVARLETSLCDAVSYRPAGEAWRWIGVEILAVNPTDRDGSLFAAELHVTYTASSSARITVVKIPHENDFAPREEALQLPVRLTANGAVRGWLSFRLHDGVASPNEIERYAATLRDSRGLYETVQTGILRELRDDTAA